MTILFLFLHLNWAQAQVVTSPLSPDQPLVNPAAAVTRPFNSFSLKAFRETENAKALELVNSSYEVDTVVDTAQLNTAWSWGHVFLEGNYSPQSGTKTTHNTYTDESSGTPVQTSKELTDKITLNPIQGLVGWKLGSSAGIGFKALTSFSDFDTTSDYQASKATETTTVDEDSSLDAKFTVIGGGITYNFSGDYYIAYAAELTQLSTKQKLSGVRSVTSDGNTRTAEIKKNGAEIKTVQKNTVGIGYLSKKSAGEILRFELSYQNIPPLNPSSDLKNGERMGLNGEMTWSYFHFGAETSITRGYYVDPYNLIPYYFRFENFSNSAVTEYGLFGGFRFSKGHSLSASLFRSVEKKEEALSFSDSSKYLVERTNQKFGLNYYFLF